MAPSRRPRAPRHCEGPCPAARRRARPQPALQASCRRRPHHASPSRTSPAACSDVGCRRTTAPTMRTRAPLPCRRAKRRRPTHRGPPGTCRPRTAHPVVVASILHSCSCRQIQA
ncbi:hypothetical protein PVAP13_5NG510186 [Panicum virgatum]|uniref:Uncharacterized protein n=1 Tax=Panicum virgatum TaxID=38727 RepID=A0A8T0S5S8_PANVG|nr:hypothetical protein PVAP13_5NG510186 [Panicum virgatum]